MSKKTIIFEIVKKDTISIIDTMSKYAVCGGLSIQDGGLADRDIYCVVMKCKKKDFDDCLSSIMDLAGNGVSIQRLKVL